MSSDRKARSNITHKLTGGRMKQIVQDINYLRKVQQQLMELSLNYELTPNATKNVDECYTAISQAINALDKLETVLDQQPITNELSTQPRKPIPYN